MLEITSDYSIGKGLVDAYKIQLMENRVEPKIKYIQSAIYNGMDIKQSTITYKSISNENWKKLKFPTLYL